MRCANVCAEVQLRTCARGQGESGCVIAHTQGTTESLINTILYPEGAPSQGVGLMACRRYTVRHLQSGDIGPRGSALHTHPPEDIPEPAPRLYDTVIGVCL